MKPCARGGSRTGGRLDIGAAARVDDELADRLPGLGWRRLRDAVEAAAIDADPSGADKAAEQAKPDRRVDVHPDDAHGLKRMSVTADAADLQRSAQRRDTDGARPIWAEATVYVHFTREQWEAARDGAAGLEGAGPITTGQARELLGHSHVTIKPVIDLDGMPTSDGRFARGRLREATVLKTPHCPFATCGGGGRRGQLDHTIPSPRGPTGLGNLSPPCTPHHRAKTHGGWRLAQPANGIYLWRSPRGRMYLVDRAGVTHPVRWSAD